MKDNEIRAVVNELTEVANRHAGHQCLRECIANVIVPVLKGRLPKPQTNREAFESYLRKNYASSYQMICSKNEEGKYLANAYKLGDPNYVVRVQHLWEVWNHGSK